MKQSVRIRTDRLALVVAMIELGFGVGVYAAPFFFATPIYAGLVPYFGLFSSAMMAGAALLFLQSRYRFPLLWERLLYLIPAGAMGWLDLHFTLNRNWPFVGGVTALALATLLIPWFPRRAPDHDRVVDLWLVAFGLAEIAAAGLMLLAPGTYSIPELQGLVPHLSWMGVLGVLGGLLLLAPVSRRLTAGAALRWLVGGLFLGLFGWFIAGPSGTIMVGAWLSGFLVFFVPSPQPADVSHLLAKPENLVAAGAAANVSVYQEIHSWMLIAVVVVASAALHGLAIQPPLIGSLFVVIAVGCNLVLNWLLVPLLDQKHRFLWHTMIHIAALDLLFTGAGSVMQPLVVVLFVFPVDLMLARGIRAGRIALAVSLVLYTLARTIHGYWTHQAILPTTSGTALITLALFPIGELVFRLLQAGRERAEALRRRGDHAALMVRISTAIHNSLEIEQILSATAQALGEAMNATRSYIFAEPGYTDAPLLFRWAKGKVTPVADRGQEVVQIVKSRVVHDGTVVMSDFLAEPWQPHECSADWSPAEQDEFRSLIATPVSLAGQIVGFIACTAGPECRTWLPEERSFVEAAAIEVGNALLHAQAHGNLTYLADHDSLTGLINRRRFQRLLEAELHLAREQGGRGALLFLDLDQFKCVNDTMGHPAGDVLLAELTADLSALIDQRCVLGRLGGDEFVVLMPGADQAAAEGLADRIRKLLHSRSFHIGGRTVSVTVSLGVALYPEHGSAIDDLLAHADIAVYQAKALGRDRYQVYQADCGQQDALNDQVDMVEQVKAAIAEHRLLVYSQPIWHLLQNRVTAHELLVRMVDEKGRVLAPGSFLEAAERSGLIRVIDRWMIAQAIELVRQDQLAGVALQVHVNLSGHTLTDSDLLPFVQARVRAAAIDPDALVFEITETVIISDMGRALAHMESLRALGCRFALDDFGSGFSSFSHLLNLPLEQIKIDGRFVQNLNESERSRAFVRAVVELARSLGMETTAEFVDREETAASLRSYGVTYAQGYLVGRPEPLVMAVTGVAD